MSLIRDPVYGWIPINKQEKIFINTSAWIQRMHRIKQCGLLYYIYPGATHSRFLHSLGVMHLAGLYAKVLNLSEKTTQKLRIAALLHDLGHGPFSHSWDYAINVIEEDSNYYNKWHDQKRHEIIKEIEKDIYSLFEISASEIIDMWSTTPYNAILQGPLGCDRLDFTLRDAYCCGSNFGVISYYRIIENSFINNGKLGYNWYKINSDIIQAILARSFQYKELYFHKTNQKIEKELNNLLVMILKKNPNLWKNNQIFIKLSDDFILTNAQIGIWGDDIERQAKKIACRQFDKSHDITAISVDIEFDEWYISCKKYNILFRINDEIILAVDQKIK